MKRHAKPTIEELKAEVAFLETSLAQKRIELGSLLSGTNLPVLTPRENQVISLMIIGKPYKEIADVLSISISTVKFHAQRIIRKKGVSCRSELLVSRSSYAA